MIKVGSMKPFSGSRLRIGHPLSRGLISHWLMNEGSGRFINNLNGGGIGTFFGDVNWNVGKFGPCLAFDGVEDYVNIPKRTTLAGKSQATISVWIYSVSFSTAPYVYCEATSTSGYARLGIRISTGGIIYVYWIDSANDPSGDCGTFTSATALSLLKWYHVVVVFDSVSDYHSIYINGVLDKLQNTAALALGTSVTCGIRIGLLPVGGTSNFNGKIDNVMVFDRALSGTEIQQLYLDPFSMFRRNP